MLKLQYFGHLIGTADSLEKSLMMGKIEGRRKRGDQRMRLLDSITDGIDMNFGKLWEMVRDREAWLAAVQGLQRVKHDWVTEQPHFHFSLSCIGEGNGNPLQCSCLQNPRDRGAW